MHERGNCSQHARGIFRPARPRGVHRREWRVRRLVTRGALLELVTFGFYRVWLATNIRRHLWSNSSVAGDAPYAVRAFGWILLIVLTLGLAYPWRAAALGRYKMGHTFYGDLAGRFTAATP